jgi:hypothetical protein
MMLYAQKHLQEWQNAWIMSNEHVSCAQCSAQQPSRLSNADFVHAPDCSCANTAQRPWQELMAILIVPDLAANPAHDH